MLLLRLGYKNCCFLLKSFFYFITAREASCHVMSWTMEKLTWQRPEVCQQPCEWAWKWAPMNLEIMAAQKDTLMAAFWETLSQRYSSKPHTDPWPIETKIIHVFFIVSLRDLKLFVKQQEITHIAWKIIPSTQWAKTKLEGSLNFKVEPTQRKRERGYLLTLKILGMCCYFLSNCNSSEIKKERRLRSYSSFPNGGLFIDWKMSEISNTN